MMHRIDARSFKTPFFFLAIFGDRDILPDLESALDEHVRSLNTHSVPATSYPFLAILISAGRSRLFSCLLTCLSSLCAGSNPPTPLSSTDSSSLPYNENAAPTVVSSSIWFLPSFFLFTTVSPSLQSLTSNRRAA